MLKKQLQQSKSTQKSHKPHHAKYINIFSKEQNDTSKSQTTPLKKQTTPKSPTTLQKNPTTPLGIKQQS
jgi:hypothetical protein